MCVKCYGPNLCWFGYHHHSYLNFQNWIYYLIFDSFAILKFISICFTYCKSMSFWRHLLPCEKLYMTSSYYFILFFNPLQFSRLILRFINLLVGTKSPHCFFVLLIVSNFVFTMLLICQVRMYGFICYLCIEIRSILIFKHEFTVSLLWIFEDLQASSIIHL